MKDRSGDPKLTYNASLAEVNKTDSQIMETLQIPSEPFFRYKFALHPLLTCLLFIYIDIDTVNLSIC